MPFLLSTYVLSKKFFRLHFFQIPFNKCYCKNKKRILLNSCVSYYNVNYSVHSDYVLSQTVRSKSVRVNSIKYQICVHDITGPELWAFPSNAKLLRTRVR